MPIRAKIQKYVGATPSWENSTCPNVCIGIPIYRDVSLVLEFPQYVEIRMKYESRSQLESLANN